MATALAERPGKAAPEPSLKEFTAHCLPVIERRLAQALEGLVTPAPAMVAALHDAVDPNGHQAHRWRPLIVMAAADACGATPEAGLDAGVAIELTHTASLMLDDLPCMDNTALRRGRPATHAQVGSSGAILAAVGLMGRAAEMLGRSPVGAGMLAAEWGDAIGLAGMSGGQVMDLEGGREQRLRGAARRLHRRKTTALARFAARAGGIVAGAPTALIDALGRFGDHLGWAYQVRDDVADRVEDRLQDRLLAMEQVAVRRARLVHQAERSLTGLEWPRPQSMEALLSAARRIAGVPTTALRAR
ncbi:MAG: polyprenyl synthetase family protein [Gemmatimonadales bacterium]